MTLSSRDGLRESHAMSAPRDLDAILPPIGSVSPAERMLRGNFLSAIERSPSGKPLLWPEFVARQGRSVHIVDVREPEELVGHSDTSGLRVGASRARAQPSGAPW